MQSAKAYLMLLDSTEFDGDEPYKMKTAAHDWFIPVTIAKDDTIINELPFQIHKNDTIRSQDFPKRVFKNKNELTAWVNNFNKNNAEIKLLL